MTIGNSVTTIGEDAFSYCTSLTTVTIGNSVTTIGDWAFSGCSSLTTVTIPDSVTSIGNSAFYGCGSLTDVYYDGDQNDFYSINVGNGNDALINATQHYAKTSCDHVYDNTYDTDCNICDFVRKINYTGDCTWTLFGGHLTISGEGAMGNYDWDDVAPWGTGITSVTIGDSVTTIGEYAFYDCYDLTSVTIGDSVTTIGEYAFYNCGLTSVTIPDSVTTIGDYAFDGIKFEASIFIGKGVVSLGDNAFGEAYVTVHPANQHFYSDYGVLINKDNGHVMKATGYQVRESCLIPDGVVVIEDRAFNNWSFSSITIPVSVTTIGYDAFDLNFELELTDVYYQGSERDRAKMKIDSSNTALLNATWHYNYHYCTYSDNCESFCNECGGYRAEPPHYRSYACQTVCDECGRYCYPMYGHTYDSDCDAYCNECGERRDPPHAYDNACDTNCNLCNETRDTKHSYKATVINPTCNTDGSTTYTCRHCGDSYTESIPATGHTYTNACDADCNECGKTRQVPHHIYDHIHDADCNVCGAIREVPDHVYDNGFDTDCNVCGDVRPVDVPDDAPTFVVEDATAREGDTFTVAIRTRNNSGIVSLKLKVGYDTDMLELVTMAEGDFTGLSFGPMDTVPFIVNWVDAIHPNNTTDGTVVLLTFRVKEGAAIGETAITVTYDPEDVYDSNFENVAFLVENGTVNVVDFLYGDANSNGKVDNKDLGLLQRYINEWEVSIDTSAADMDGNGKVNNLDLGLLQRYLNGWDITLNPVRPTVALPTTPYDVDGKGRIFVESIALEGDTVSVLFANHHTKWISEETSYVKYICTDSAGNVLTTDDKHYGYLYFGVLEVGGSRLMTFTLPESTAKVEFGDAYIFYWTQWA